MNTNNFALITGGTNGIGLELAKLLAADRYNLIIVARDPVKLNEVRRQLMHQYPIEVVTIQKDLFEGDAPYRVYEMVKAKNLTVDILINTAGQGVYGKFMDTDLYRELDIIQLDISASVVLAKYFLYDMLDRNTGKILNASFVAGKVLVPYQAVYHGTKAFVHFFSAAIRSESKATGVTVPSFLPGAT